MDHNLRNASIYPSLNKSYIWYSSSRGRDSGLSRLELSTTEGHSTKANLPSEWSLSSEMEPQHQLQFPLASIKFIIKAGMVAYEWKPICPYQFLIVYLWHLVMMQRLTRRMDALWFMTEPIRGIHEPDNQLSEFINIRLVFVVTQW